MIVGEGGVSPEYFLNRMQWWEVQHYLIGLRRRYHSEWETTRALQWWLVCMFPGKNNTPPSSAQDMYKYSWEEESEPVESQITPEEAAAMQKMMDKFRW